MEWVVYRPNSGQKSSATACAFVNSALPCGSGFLKRPFRDANAFTTHQPALPTALASLRIKRCDEHWQTFFGTLLPIPHVAFNVLANSNRKVALDNVVAVETARLFA